MKNAEPEVLEALFWWYDTLSINEQNALIEKHHPGYPKICILGNRTYIYEMWKKEFNK